MMKDAYSFDADEEGAKKSYEEMRKAYVRIFDRLGLTYRMVAADSGAIGGSTSAEFQVLVDSGEDAIVACDMRLRRERRGGHGSRRVATPVASRSPNAAREKVHTPGHGGIADVATVPRRLAEADAEVARCTRRGRRHVRGVMAVVRGDHEVNPRSASRARSASTEVFLATEADVKKATGAAVGFAGPVGSRGASSSTARRPSSEERRHRRERDRPSPYRRRARPRLRRRGRRHAPRCDRRRVPPLRKGQAQSYKGIEGGHIFILGTHYTSKMGASFSTSSSKSAISSWVATASASRASWRRSIEQHHDANGIRWPMPIAPYHVHLCTLGKDPPLLAAAEKLYEDLWAKGVEVLWDDRDERPGVKFKDADLIGIPVRVTFGGKSFAAGNVEVKLRAEADPKKADAVPLAGAVEAIFAMVHTSPQP
jgi:prolyl-tRNA synthetase